MPCKPRRPYGRDDDEAKEIIVLRESVKQNRHARTKNCQKPAIFLAECGVKSISCPMRAPLHGETRVRYAVPPTTRLSDVPLADPDHPNTGFQRGCERRLNLTLSYSWS